MVKIRMQSAFGVQLSVMDEVTSSNTDHWLSWTVNALMNSGDSALHQFGFLLKLSFVITNNQSIVSKFVPFPIRLFSIHNFTSAFWFWFFFGLFVVSWIASYFTLPHEKSYFVDDINHWCRWGMKTTNDYCRNNQTKIIKQKIYI